MYRLLFLLLLCCPADSTAQRKFVPDFLEAKIVYLKAGSYKPVNIEFPFSSVIVRDSRYDTGKVGFIYEPTLGGARKLLISGGLAGAVSSFYNEYYKNSFTGDSVQLVIFIKRFWADPKPNRRLQVPEPVMRRNSWFDLHVQFEFLFKKQNLFIPIKRVDTVFQWFAGTANPDYNFYTEKSYREYEYSLLKIIESIDFNYYAQNIHKAGSPKNYDEIKSFNNRRFKIPILQDSVLKPGVYMSFGEFKANKPSVEKYRLVSSVESGNMIYNDLPGDTARIFKFWGFCDGKKIYFGKIRLPLKRTGNTFEVFADDNWERLIQASGDVSSVTSVAASLIASAITSKQHHLEPFQLDMDTGKIY